MIGCSPDKNRKGEPNGKATDRRQDHRCGRDHDRGPSRRSANGAVDNRERTRSRASSIWSPRPWLRRSGRRKSRRVPPRHHRPIARVDMMSLVVAQGSTSYHLCGGLPLAGIGADVRGSREIPAWNLRRDHVCYRDFGLVVPALNAFQGLILAGAPRQVRRW